MLNIKAERRASVDDIKVRMQVAEGKLRSLQEEVQTCKDVTYQPPKAVTGLPDEELNEAIYKTAKMYAIWRRIEATALAVHKSLQTLEKALEAILRQQIYHAVSKEALKDELLQDKEYLRMQDIGFYLLNDVIGVAEGEAKAWSRINEALSRVVELRRESARGRGR